jgi:hypothetical protein
MAESILLMIKLNNRRKHNARKVLCLECFECLQRNPERTSLSIAFHQNFEKFRRSATEIANYVLDCILLRKRASTWRLALLDHSKYAWPIQLRDAIILIVCGDERREGQGAIGSIEKKVYPKWVVVSTSGKV